MNINEKDYMAGLDESKTRLHGRIIINKGDKFMIHLKFALKINKS